MYSYIFTLIISLYIQVKQLVLTKFKHLSEFIDTKRLQNRFLASTLLTLPSYIYPTIFSNNALPSSEPCWCIAALRSCLSS